MFNNVKLINVVDRLKINWLNLHKLSQWSLAMYGGIWVSFYQFVHFLNIYFYFHFETCRICLVMFWSMSCLMVFLEVFFIILDSSESCKSQLHIVTYTESRVIDFLSLLANFKLCVNCLVWKPAKLTLCGFAAFITKFAPPPLFPFTDVLLIL